MVVSEDNFGIALSLYAFFLGVVFLSEINLGVGSLVFRLFELMVVPVSSSMLSCTVNSLGLDHKFSILKSKILKLYHTCADFIKRLVEIKAPSILSRQSIQEALETGCKVIDSIIPIGLGQRELIIGDRQTGKTSVVTDPLIIN